MSEYSSYFLYQKYIKIGEQDWIPCYPNVYSLSGDSENPMSLVEKSSADTACGYDPSVTTYRWVNLDPSVDYYCSGTTKYYKQQKQVSYDGGQTWSNVEPAEYQMGASAETQSLDCTPSYIYRWVNLDPTVDYYCSGTTKYYKQQKQQSADQGQTWENVIPAQYQYGQVAEYESTDCGYIHKDYRWIQTEDTVCVEVVGDYKLFTRSYPHTLENDRRIPCDASGVLSREIVQSYYYGGYQGWSYIVIGDCVTEIGEDTFKGFNDIGLGWTSSFEGTIIEAKVPPTLHLHSGIIVTKGLYVPAESFELYKTAPIWSNYADKMIPN